MKSFVLTVFISLLCFNTDAAEFSISYYPDKVVVLYPKKSRINDKMGIIVLENKLAINLVVQVIRDNEIVGNISVAPNKVGNLNVNKLNKSKYFVRTVQPASELIELKFNGRQVEIP